MNRLLSALGVTLFFGVVVLAISGCQRTDGPGSPGWPRVTPEEARAAYRKHLQSMQQAGGPPGGPPRTRSAGSLPASGAGR